MTSRKIAPEEKNAAPSFYKGWGTREMRSRNMGLRRKLDEFHIKGDFDGFRIFFKSIQNITKDIIDFAIGLYPKIVFEIDAQKFKDKMNAFYILAVRRDTSTIDVFKQINNPTLDICNLALSMNLEALKYIPKEYYSEKLLLNAFTSDSQIEDPAELIFSLIDQSTLSEKFFKRMLKYDLNSFRHIKSPSESICKAALFNDGLLLKYITNKTDKHRLYAYHSTRHSIRHFDVPVNDPIYIKALKHNSRGLYYIDQPTYELCELAVKDDWVNLGAVPTHLIDESLCIAAYNQNPLALRFLWPDVGFPPCHSEEHKGGYTAPFIHALYHVDKELSGNYVWNENLDGSIFKKIVQCQLARDLECQINEIKNKANSHFTYDTKRRIDIF